MSNPVTRNLLRDVSNPHLGALRANSEDGVAVGVREAQAIIGTMAANFTLSEVRESLAELRKLPPMHRARLTNHDLDRLQSALGDAAFYQPEAPGRFPETLDADLRNALAPVDRLLYDGAAKTLETEYKTASDAFVRAVDVGDTGAAQQRARARAAAQMRTLTHAATQLASVQPQLDAARFDANVMPNIGSYTRLRDAFRAAASL